MLTDIVVNRARCRRCGDVVESTEAEAPVWCRCGTIAVDSGRAQLRHVGDPEAIEELSERVHRHALAHDYAAIIALVEHGGLETEEVRQLNGDRSVIHDQIIAAFARLGVGVVDRTDAARRALAIARR